MKKKTRWEVAAVLAVHEIPNMTDKGRKGVCCWLRKMAADIQREPESFASKAFRARYLYPVKSEAK